MSHCNRLGPGTQYGTWTEFVRALYRLISNGIGSHKSNSFWKAVLWLEYWVKNWFSDEVDEYPNEYRLAYWLKSVAAHHLTRLFVKTGLKVSEWAGTKGNSSKPPSPQKPRCHSPKKGCSVKCPSPQSIMGRKCWAKEREQPHQQRARSNQAIWRRWGEVEPKTPKTSTRLANNKQEKVVSNPIAILNPEVSIRPCQWAKP